MDIFDIINKQRIDNMSLPRELTDKDKSRSWKPYKDSVYYDRLNGYFVQINNGFAWSESKKEAVVLSKFDRTMTFVVMLKSFNDRLEDGYVRFIEINNPNLLVSTRNMLDEAVELLKEAQEELSLEDMRLQDKIKNFLNGLK